MFRKISLLSKKIISVEMREIIKRSKIFNFLRNKVAKYFQKQELEQWILAKKTVRLKKIVQKYRGINIIGFFDVGTGLSTAAESSVRALNKVQAPTQVVNFDLSVNFRNPLPFKFEVNLIHTNPPEYPLLWRRFQKNLAKYNIGFWYWELTEIPSTWHTCFDVLDEIWVATTFVQDAIEKVSPIPVKKIPPCVHVEFDPTATRQNFNLPDDQFLFMVAYDTHSVSERKNPLATIQAFKEAFSLRTDVGLVIKIRNTTHDGEMLKRIKKEIGGFTNIYLLDMSFSKLKFYSLLNLINAYVSLHRSEGFGLIPAESMFLAKPVVMTGWSGNVDFMTADNSCSVNYKLVPVPDSVPFYEAGKLWAEPDIRHAAELMNLLVHDAAFYQKIAIHAERFIKNNLSPQKIGYHMKQRLEEIKNI
jgi:hypothetical protein